MNHTHLDSCPSTQIFLKENLSDLRRNGKDILVSTIRQTAGIGRLDHHWEHFQNALAFSCTFDMNVLVTPPSLFLAASLVDFFEENYKKRIKLKWPNDLYLPERKKCGGILCHKRGDVLIAGIGLNWGKAPQNSLNASGIFSDEKLNSLDYKELPEKIYSFLSSRLTDQKKIQEKWNHACLHLGEEVCWKEGAREYQGIFRGIDTDGSALIGDKSFLAGSIFLDTFGKSS